MWHKSYRPKAAEIQQAARAIIRVLAEHNFRCCVTGSTAAAIYGAENRNPRDVDVIILNASNADLEDIKYLITENSSSDFYIVPSKDPRATHKILYYTLTPQFPDPSLPLHKACKVDLLVPGILGIPAEGFPQRLLYYDDHFPDIPLTPFLVLLLLKVRAWSEHRADPHRTRQQKAQVDESDIVELLDLGVNEYLVRAGKVKKWIGCDWIDEMGAFVKEYAEKYPKNRAMWEEMGFVVRSEWSLPPDRN